MLTAYEELENDDDKDGEEVGIDEEVLGGGVYSGQSVLVDWHCVIVTVAVIYMVLVVVCATTERALAAKTINDEACILTAACCVCILLLNENGEKLRSSGRSSFDSQELDCARWCSICLTELVGERETAWSRPEFGKQNCEGLVASSAENPARNECELANGNCWLSRSKRECKGVVYLDI